MPIYTRFVQAACWHILHDVMSYTPYVSAMSPACGFFVITASAQDKRSGEAGYEARLQKAEERVSTIAAAAEARSQAKMLAEVERYKARHSIPVIVCDQCLLELDTAAMHDAL